MSAVSSSEFHMVADSCCSSAGSEFATPKLPPRPATAANPTFTGSTAYVYHSRWARQCTVDRGEALAEVRPFPDLMQGPEQDMEDSPMWLHRAQSGSDCGDELSDPDILDLDCGDEIQEMSPDAACRCVPDFLWQAADDTSGA